MQVEGVFPFGLKEFWVPDTISPLEVIQQVIMQGEGVIPINGLKKGTVSLRMITFNVTKIPFL